MGESRNITGTAYALTVFTAIIPGHEEELREEIESLPRGDASPLARLEQLHTSRLQIIDHLIYQGAPQQRDELKSNYLLFTAAFDGTLDSFLDALVEKVGPDADRWWRHCVAYPALADRAAFGRWIRRNQVHTTLFAVASQNQSVATVRESLALRERVLEFAIAAQGLSPEELQERFRRTFAEVK
jgi:hypothetical protein